MSPSAAAAADLRSRLDQPPPRSRLGARAGGAGADFLLVRAAEDLGDRLSLVKRRFALAADFGSPGPHGAAALAAGGQVDCVIRVAPTRASLGTGDFLRRGRRPRASAHGRRPPRPRRLAARPADGERPARRADPDAARA